MAENVIQADPVRPAGKLGRAGAVLERVGTRGVARRDMDAAFAVLAAQKRRGMVGRVRKHVCRHDEGIADCRSTVVEG